MAKRNTVSKKKTGSRVTPRRDARVALIDTLKDSMRLVEMFKDGKATLEHVAARKEVELGTHPATAEAWGEVLETEQFVLSFIRKQDQTAAQAETLLKGKGDWAVVGDEVTVILMTLQSQQDAAAAKVSEFVMSLAEVQWPEHATDVEENSEQ